MKNLILPLLILFTLSSTLAQVGIGTPSPETSALLEVKSNTKGFLPPRLTDAQRDNINSPAEGLVIFNITTICLEVFDGIYWNNLCTGARSVPPNPNLTASNISYQGQSIINNQGIGYNGEAVPTASTITVELANSAATTQNYILEARDETTGLVYTASGTIAANATGVSVVLTHNGVTIPEFTAGALIMGLQGVSNAINLEPRIDVKSIPTSATEIKDVTVGTQTWMDRNLGARRPATGINDIFSYGNHYQWGRPTDGHEITVWNGITKTDGRGFEGSTSIGDLASSDTPNTPRFIRSGSSPFDWRQDNNNNRWASANQGPCPTGYHVPTTAEWNAADAAAIGNGNGPNGNSTPGLDNHLEAAESVLKLPSSGLRINNTNLMLGSGDSGHFWTSTPLGIGANYFNTTITLTEVRLNVRGHGINVRCIKD